MSKKNAIILILLVFLLILGGLLFSYFSSNNDLGGGDTTPEINTPNSPFGDNGANRTSTTTKPGKEPGSEYVPKDPIKKLATLRQLYTEPVSGSVILDKNNTTKVRFVNRATGNVHEIFSDSDEVRRVTNTLIPKILEAVWSNTGEALVLRYSISDNEKIDNYLGNIKVSTSTTNAFAGEVKGSVIYQNADSIIINPSGSKTFGLIKKKNLGGSYGLISAINNSSSKEIFNSDISEWLISWSKDNTISFVTKPSYKQRGYLFFLDTDTGSFDKVLGSIYGLTALVNKDTNRIAYSSSFQRSSRLNVFDIKQNIDKYLQVETLSDKCVWGNLNKEILYCAVPKNIPDDNYPDSWYQGVVSFSDNIWKIDVEKGTTELLYEIGSSEKVSLDAYDLKISAKDDFLVFTDKNTLSLWGLSIKK